MHTFTMQAWPLLAHKRSAMYACRVHIDSYNSKHMVIYHCALMMHLCRGLAGACERAHAVDLTAMSTAILQPLTCQQELTCKSLIRCHPHAATRN